METIYATYFFLVPAPTTYHICMREFLFVFKTNKNGFYFSSNFITVFTLDGSRRDIIRRAANSVSSNSRKKGFLFKDLLYRVHEIKLEAFKTSRPFPWLVPLLRDYSDCERVIRIDSSPRGRTHGGIFLLEYRCVSIFRRGKRFISVRDFNSISRDLWSNEIISLLGTNRVHFLSTVIIQEIISFRAMCNNRSSG